MTNDMHYKMSNEYRANVVSSPLVISSIRHSSFQAPRGFTLVELLMVVAIISILAALAVTALAGAAEEGRRARAESQITKIDSLLTRKWNEYRYRQIPIRIPSGTSPAVAARCRLNALRDLMRMEMPDRFHDIVDGPVVATPANPYVITARPSLSNAYYRKLSASTGTTSPAWDQAECLYLILSEIRDGEDSALQYFMPSEIGDIDSDGLNEILDPWGTPIMWLRWAPGHSAYTNEDAELAGLTIPIIDFAVTTFQVPNGTLRPDPFDPLKIDNRWLDQTAGAMKPFELKPLIWSAGPDKVHDILISPADATGAPTLRYQQTTPPNDPYVVIVSANNRWIGVPYDADGDGQYLHSDNITSHAIVVGD